MVAAGVIIPTSSDELFSFVESQSGHNIRRCYQCGKCTAGCPVTYAMDLGPRKIMHSIQLGLKDEALNNNTIWMCIFCQTCSVRCPRQIDISKVMESLRYLAIAERRLPPEREIKLFHRLFLDRIKKQGRIHELNLVIRYNLQSRHPFTNASLLPAMLSKRKLSLLPPKVKGASEIKRMFVKVKEIEEKDKKVDEP